MAEKKYDAWLEQFEVCSGGIQEKSGRTPGIAKYLGINNAGIQPQITE